jgi:N-acyl-D-aspartate/D-glutamate deacylase
MNVGTRAHQTGAVLDLLITGGTVVDGTGAPGVRADVGVAGGVVVAVGEAATGEPAVRTVDADGLVVAPGFVDIHTHYDAQVFWDPALTPSPYHGVTTVMSGNCGLTLAPMGDEHQDFLVRLLARVEQIPVDALRAGVEVRWRTFGEFLAAVDALPLALNIGFLTGHSAVRRLTMGESASSDPARPDHVAAMQALLRDALAAGSFGLSSSTALNHRDGDGRPTPPNFARADELIALAEVVGEFPGTCLEYIPGSFMTGFSDDDVATMAAMSRRADRHLNWNTVMINGAEPDLWRRQLALTDRARALGGWVVPQAIPHNFRTRTDFADAELGFRNLPGWDGLFALPPAERVRRLADPAVHDELRRALATAVNPFATLYREGMGRVVVNDVADPTRFGHLVGRSLAALAADPAVAGDDPVAVACLLASSAHLGIGFCRFAFAADDAAVQEARHAMLRDPRVLLGASDGGAHLDGTVNVEYPTASFAELVRERAWFSVEELVHQLADVPARLYGLHDRGRIAAGMRADLVLFDPATIAPGPAVLVQDLPGGARRFVAKAVGIDRVVVAGTEVVRDGELTGASPGTLLRAGRDSVTVPVEGR